MRAASGLRFAMGAPTYRVVGSPADSEQEVRVDAAGAGRRLDLFLAERLGLSRAQVRRLLARGAVSLDGRPLPVSAKGMGLPAGARLRVAPFERPGRERVRPEPQAPLVVLAEGPGWLAVDKPAGTPVHPLREGETGSLLAAVAARHPGIQGVGEGGLRSGVVHRLDVDTSGVVLFATREPEWQRLRRAFREHRVEKVYRALVRGRLLQEGEVRVCLAMARHRPARVRVLRPEEEERARGVWRCVTSVRPLEALRGATLVEARPQTGFLHQIRAVLAHLGHPVLGDAVYGGPAEAAAAPRHMLHAASLAFEEVSARSPDARDFAELLARLRSGGASAAGPARGGAW
jgi:23S rRNA pseudouridine1911/1915/1917 synthase